MSEDTLPYRLKQYQEEKQVLEAYKEALKPFATYKTPNARIKPELTGIESLRSSIKFEQKQTHHLGRDLRCSVYYWGTGGAQHVTFNLDPTLWYSDLQIKIQDRLKYIQSNIDYYSLLLEKLSTIEQDEAHICNLLMVLRKKWNQGNIPAELVKRCPLILGSKVHLYLNDQEPYAEY